MKNPAAEKRLLGDADYVAGRHRKLARHNVPGSSSETDFVPKGRLGRIQNVPSSRRDENSFFRPPGTLSPANFRSSFGAKRLNRL
jgi:hypothetical protein